MDDYHRLALDDTTGEISPGVEGTAHLLSDQVHQPVAGHHHQRVDARAQRLDALTGLMERNFGVSRLASKTKITLSHTYPYKQDRRIAVVLQWNF